MKMNGDYLLARIAVIRQQARLTLDAVDELEKAVHRAVVTAVPVSDETPIPVGPIGETTESTGSDCTCPPNKRVSTAVSGHPTRTMCRACKKEYES